MGQFLSTTLLSLPPLQSKWTFNWKHLSDAAFDICLLFDKYYYAKNMFKWLYFANKLDGITKLTHFNKDKVLPQSISHTREPLFLRTCSFKWCNLYSFLLMKFQYFYLTKKKKKKVDLFKNNMHRWIYKLTCNK